MSLVEDYVAARHAEAIARLRRVVALRAMAETGMSQRDAADALAISQPAVSQQLKTSRALVDVHPEALLEAASPILRRVAEDRGFTELAVFGSVARHQARPDSDIDLVVRPPAGTSISGMIELQSLFGRILGRSVDLVSYGGLTPVIDDDIRAEAVPL